MDEIKSRSPYWLSPGIDVPTQEELQLLPSRRALRGFYVDRNAGEAAFVPTDDFMRECPLWRIDVLDDFADACSARVRMPWFPSSGNVRQEDMTCPWRGRSKHFAKCASKVMLHCRMNWRRCWFWISSSADQRRGAPESGARGEHRQSLPRRAVPRLARGAD
jgi:hypothetical protein